MARKRFQLDVEFKPRKANGDVDWNARTFFWRRTFNFRHQAMGKFMRMVANLWFVHDNKLRPFCNLRGTLIENPNTSEEKILHSWDWEEKEIRDEWARSPACAEWLAEITSTPSIPIKKERVVAGVLLTDILFELKLCSSKGDARRKIEEGGVRINGVKVSDAKRNILIDDFQNNSILLSRGKSHKHKLHLE